MKTNIGKQLTKAFKKRGYRAVETNNPMIELFYKRFEKAVCGIVILEDMEGMLNHPYMFESWIQQAKQHIPEGDDPVYVLGIAISDSPSRTKEYCVGLETKWLIDETNKRLMIFENQEADFFDARPLVEEALQQSFTQDKPPFSIETAPIITWILVGINLILQIIVSQKGKSSSVLYEFGAILVRGFDWGSDSWRLIASAFLHFDWRHFCNNMIILLYLGSLTERMLGKWKYLLLYLVTAVGANIISLAWYQLTQNTAVITAGASGAVFGVTGALLWILLCSRGQVERLSGWQLLMMIVFSLYNGITSIGINNSAHVGGLIVGFLAASILYRKKHYAAE